MNIFTDEDIKEIVGPWGDTPIKGYTRSLFDKIEAKLREKQAEPETQSTHSTDCYKWHHKCAIAEVERRRAALAEPQPEPEPVAWMVYTEDGASAYVTDNPNDLVGAYRALPLYTTAPQRQPLSDERIILIYETPELAGTEFANGTEKAIAIFRAAERAHGIGGDK